MVQYRLTNKVYMILTFAELQITMADYNGMNARDARASVINLAGDRVNGNWNNHAYTSVESLYDWSKSQVDFVNHTVTLIASPYDSWVLINS